MTGDPMTKSLFEINNVSVAFGGNVALKDVSMNIPTGNISAIIGPNGAGKSTLLNLINSFYRFYQGRIEFEGKDLKKLVPHKVAALGIARTFQNAELFKNMTVLENLLLGCHNLMRHGLFSDILFYAKSFRDELLFRNHVEEIIDFLEMEKWRHRIVGKIPLGVQKRVELGRALAMDPKVILLDEPTTGMNTEEREDIVRFILDIHEEKGIDIILIEHAMEVVMDISDYIYVLEFGNKIAEGSPDKIQKNKKVTMAYLGE